MDHRFRKFLAVAETGSFSQAAKKLHVTQPAITLAVGSLERAFGVKLHTRHKYTVELTKEGEIVARSAKKLLAEVEHMESELRHHVPRSNQQVGIIDSIAHLLYASPKERQILEDIDVKVDNSNRILGDLRSKKIDVGVITGQANHLGSDVTVHKLHSEEFVFVCAPQLAPQDAVTRIDDWLAINQDSTSYRHFVRLFKKEGLTVTPIFFSTSLELLRSMAINGKGTALLPKHLVEHDLEDNSLSIVKTKHLYRPIWAVMRKNHAVVGDLSVLTAQLDELLTSEG